jgi:hypothetical protein
MVQAQNIFQMYMANNYRFGFFITRSSWKTGRMAMVVAIDGVKEGEPIEGTPPYFNRCFPAGHPKEGKIWPRTVHLKADWFDDGTYQTESGGTYSWSRVFL